MKRRLPNIKMIVSSALALAIGLSSIIVIAKPASAAGLTSMSLTGTGITANSSETSTAITPTINFTLANAVSSSDTITITLNGTTTTASLAAANVTVGGTCSGTVSMSTISISTDNPVLEITGITCTAGAATVIIASSKLSSSATAGNYAVDIQTPADNGSFFYYVGNENDVYVTGTVNDTLAFVIRNSDDTSDQANVSGGAVGPNLCDLGTIATNAVAQCAYRLKVTTNAVSGYNVYYTSSASGFTNGTYSMTNAAATTGTTSAAGTESYGAVLAEGAATSGTIARGAVFGANASKAYDLSATLATEVLSSTGPNAPATSGDTTNTALVTHEAAISASTPAGVYTQTVTYTVSANF